MAARYLPSNRRFTAGTIFLSIEGLLTIENCVPANGRKRRDAVVNHPRPDKICDRSEDYASDYEWHPIDCNPRRACGTRVGCALGVWRFTADRWSLLVDRVYTARMLVIRSTPFGWNGTYLQFEDAIPGLVGLKGFNFVLGPRAGTVPGDDRPIPAFAAEAGDKTSLVFESSLLGWPAPFTLAGTYLSGAPTTWMRHLYYRLSWRKASGAQLAMVWRCEQGWERINGWHNFGFAELIQVEIRPAAPSQSANR